MSALKSFNPETEFEFRKRLRNIYNAAQEIAFSFRDDAASYSPSQTFSEAHASFLREYLKIEDLFDRRARLVAKHPFVTNFALWVDSVLPALPAGLSDFPDLSNTISEIFSRITSAKTYSEAESQFPEIDAAFDGFGAGSPALPPLRDLSVRRGACILARLAVQELTAFQQIIPEAPDRETREYERLKLTVAEKQRQVGELRVELQRKKEDETAFDREIDQLRQEINDTRREIESSARDFEESERSLQDQLKKEQDKVERLRKAQSQITALWPVPESEGE
jgi:hypothetical protein